MKKQFKPVLEELRDGKYGNPLSNCNYMITEIKHQMFSEKLIVDELYDGEEK